MSYTNSVAFLLSEGSYRTSDHPPWKNTLFTCLELQLAFPTVWLSFFDEAIFTLH